MCMSIEYHLYLIHFFYHVNDYNRIMIFVFMFMGGSMSAGMLLFCYLPMTMLIITLSIVLYCMYNLIIVYKQFCHCFLYESCVNNIHFLFFFLLVAKIIVRAFYRIFH